MLVTPCVARYVCGGWCGATPLCCPQDMCWLVWYHRLGLPAIYVLVVVLPPACVACYVCAGWCGATPLCYRYACAGWCGASLLRCTLCMCLLVRCHSLVLLPKYVLVGVMQSLVLPAMYVLVGVVPLTCVARYVCVG